MKTKRAFIRKTTAGLLCVLMLLGTFGPSVSAVKLENPQVITSETTISPDIESEDYYLGSETFTVSDEAGLMFVSVRYQLFKENDSFLSYEADYVVYTYASDPEKKPLTSIEIEIPYPEDDFYRAVYSVHISNMNGQYKSFPVQMISVDYIMEKALKAQTVYGLELDDYTIAEVRNILTNAKGNISDTVLAERDAVLAQLDALEAKIEASKKAEADEKQALLDRVDRLERQLPAWAVILISVAASTVLTSVAWVGYLSWAKKKKTEAEGTEKNFR